MSITGGVVPQDGGAPVLYWHPEMAVRRVVVDGSNIATEGRTLPSLRQLNEAVLAFMTEYPEAEVTVVVDATFGHRIDDSEVPEFEEAEANNELVSPPAGAIGRGDAFLLRIAGKIGATVLSNDSFQEFHGEHEWLFEDGRLVGGKPVPGIGWIFTPRTPVRGIKSRKAVKDAKHRVGGPALAAAPTLSGEPLGPMPVPSRPPPRKKAAESNGARQGQRDAVRVADAIATATAESVTGSNDGRRRRRKKRGSRPAEPVNEALAFINFLAEHPLGSEVEGEVETFTSHGAFVLAGARCYVPISALGDPPPRAARDVLNKGERRRFVVQALDPQRRGIELALPEFAHVAGAPLQETIEAEISEAPEDEVVGGRAGEQALAPAGDGRPRKARTARRAPAGAGRGPGAAEGDEAAAAVAVPAGDGAVDVAAPGMAAPAGAGEAPTRTPAKRTRKRMPSTPEPVDVAAPVMDAVPARPGVAAGQPVAPPAAPAPPGHGHGQPGSEEGQARPAPASTRRPRKAAMGGGAPLVEPMTADALRGEGLAPGGDAPGGSAERAPASKVARRNPARADAAAAPAGGPKATKAARATGTAAAADEIAATGAADPTKAARAGKAAKAVKAVKKASPERTPVKAATTARGAAPTRALAGADVSPAPDAAGPVTAASRRATAKVAGAKATKATKAAAPPAPRVGAATTTRSGAKTATSGADIAKPGAATAKSSVKTATSGADIAKPGAATAKSSARTSKSSPKTAKSSAKTAKATTPTKTSRSTRGAKATTGSEPPGEGSGGA